MSLLHDIIRDCGLHGRCEVNLARLLNGYFRGDTDMDDLRAWASAQGLRVTIKPPLHQRATDSARLAVFGKDPSTPAPDAR